MRVNKRKTDVELVPCKICGINPQIIRISDAGVVPSKATWWYRIECRSFHHVITITNKDKKSVATIWNHLNTREEEK